MIRDLTPPTVAEALQEGARYGCRATVRVRKVPWPWCVPLTRTHPPALDDQAATTLLRIAQNALRTIRANTWTYWSPSTGTPIVSKSK